ncbi:hypothetical protein E4T39_04977 [Aureobasidium subglaciale]|nr:hypothetical protein E4T39_04977 [Aureobasidium subglaciale]
MKPSQLLLGIAAAAAGGVHAATPPGSDSQVPNSLGLVFDKNIITPGELVAQSVADAAQPSLFYTPHLKPGPRGLKKHPLPLPLPKPLDKTYLFTLVDLNLPFFALPATTDFASLVPGIGPNRTTRLHWFSYDNHALPPFFELKNQSVEIAEYQGPMPPQGDEPHNYVLYLFEQPKGFNPAVYLSKNYDEDSFARMNFSIKALEQQVGAPVAANYFLVENENNTSTA